MRPASRLRPHQAPRRTPWQAAGRRHRAGAPSRAPERRACARARAAQSPRDRACSDARNRPVRPSGSGVWAARLPSLPLCPRCQRATNRGSGSGMRSASAAPPSAAEKSAGAQSRQRPRRPANDARSRSECSDAQRRTTWAVATADSAPRPPTLVISAASSRAASAAACVTTKLPPAAPY